MTYNLRKTRFSEIGYVTYCGIWRFVDAASGPLAIVGPIYRTKAELLADLPRYARDSWGLE